MRIDDVQSVLLRQRQRHIRSGSSHACEDLGGESGEVEYQMYWNESWNTVRVHDEGLSQTEPFDIENRGIERQPVEIDKTQYEKDAGLSEVLTL